MTWGSSVDAPRSDFQARTFAGICDCGRSSRSAYSIFEDVTRSWMGALWQDVRFGLRMLAKSPGFTTVAVLTLALGIGANAAIFSILDPLLLRKLPVRNPDELVLVHAAGTIHGEDSSELSSYFIYRDNATVFSGVLAASIISGLPVTKDGETTPITSESVSGNFFEVLGVHPFRGRLLIPSDSQANHDEHVAVLGFDYWRREFHGDA